VLRSIYLPAVLHHFETLIIHDDPDMLISNLPAAPIFKPTFGVWASCSPIDLGGDDTTGILPGWDANVFKFQPIILISWILVGCSGTEIDRPCQITSIALIVPVEIERDVQTSTKIDPLHAPHPMKLYCII
jgi:hypothetical protein